MKTIQLTIPGSTPSKKNSKRIIYVRGKPIILSSKLHEGWHKEAVRSIKKEQETIQSCQSVTLVFYSKDKRKFDLSNKTESILDLLVDVEIIEDDNYSVIPELIIKYGGLDRENPRCEVSIQM